MYAVNHIDSFEILVRKRVVGFIEQLKVSTYSIIICIDNSWKVKFDKEIHELNCYISNELNLYI